MLYMEELYQTPQVLKKVMAFRCSRLTGKRLVFCGCGTSFYIGGQVSNLYARRGMAAAAADAIDVITGDFRLCGTDHVVFISRSGNSMETVLALEAAKRAGAKCFYLGCGEDSVLKRACEGSAVIPWANEENILESYSYYAQLLLACMCCGIFPSAELPFLVSQALEKAEDYFARHVQGHALTRMISLGPSFYRPQNREMMLKDGEITGLPAESWGTLEFRHGPRAWADEHTLIEIIPGKNSREWDEKVARELIGYGCRVRVYSESVFDGAYSYRFKADSYSLEEVLSAAAFHVCVAAHIGRELGSRPESLPHIVHNVGDL